MPSAESENALHRASGASPPCSPSSPNPARVDMTVTPPATASEHSPLRRAWAAMWMVTSDDEHAVSTVTAGPSRPKV
ncbi:hypothetical protein Aple_058520 [Acrocarpospora pleiomorpha]|uniref:Uncharacterized protein n=1 Tax=Acrocarpospora pleiomorpha TaxID=90975 RepID=A0A5M3XUF2_9ACTN|nr:hypothetical protein Aple_058520 [Acrocarpospora pleiomorpha]